MEVHPTYLPSVPRIFEKIYTLVTLQRATRRRSPGRQAVALGLKVRALQAAGQDGPEPSCRPHFDKADAELFANVRNAVRRPACTQATTGAAPIAPEILEFFYACGVPVLEGYGMTETATVATTSTVERPPARHRRPRAARAARSGSPTTARS